MTLQGWVDEQLSPRIKIQASVGTALEVVIDTGFNGEMVLPKRHLEELGFTYRGWTVVELADGSKVASELYEGAILWFGEEKKVRVHATESEDALLGTRMLIGHLFELDVEGNRVVVTKKT